jgi:putative ubiquitin-RnfH superfamily antitoxin RatB of RatAB toxin-antitoxin module
MDYIIVSTSNSDYQSWQCKLLEYSFKKVNQPGKLIRLCSHNTHAANRMFDISDVSEIIKVPDYRTRWSNYTKKDLDYGIANKIESIKYWLYNYDNLQDNHNVLLVDPDMVFLKPVTMLADTNSIIGQRWMGNDVSKHRIFQENIYIANNIHDDTCFMYPYITTVGVLKKIVKTYADISYKLRLDNYPNLWEAEMFGLIFSAHHNDIKIKTYENLGYCTSWKNDSKDFIDSVSILHYPNSIHDKNNNKIFNKQDYTPLTKSEHWKLINPNDASTHLEHKFLQVLENYNIEKKIKFYWDNPEWIDALGNYKKNLDTTKYIVFKPWPGGFNNIRMSLEIAASLAFLLHRVLVLPPAYKMYLLENVNDFNTFFDITDIGIHVITFEEYCEKMKIHSFTDVEKISHVVDHNIVNLILSTSETPVFENKLRGRNVVNLLEHKDQTTIYFPNNLLGNFYLNIFSENQAELCKFVARYIHYKPDIFIQAYKAIEVLGDLNYYAIHVRRNDFQYKDLTIPAEDIFNNIKNAIPFGSKLYIATDELDKTFFDVFTKHYQVFYYDDVNTKISSSVNTDFNGMIDQIICARAKVFIGTKLSTFSNYIYRLRGYMPDVSDKRFLTYNVPCNATDEEPEWWIASWARDYKEVWESIDTITYFSPNLPEKIDTRKSIFVSIASYRDSQLTDTIDSLLENQSGNNNIVIGVCMQDTLEKYNEFKYKNHPNVTTLFVPYTESIGVGWARHKVQQEIYTNEDYFLQIDSHSRACKNWDEILINQINKCDTHKAVLSTYPNNFDKHDSSQKYFLANTASWLKVTRLVEGEKIVPTSGGIVKSDKPILGFWVAAGFLFTRGSWAKQVVYNPDIYFSGEEDHLSLISYLNGWDVYVPETSTIWHDYTDNRLQSKTKYRRLHWEDHGSKINHNPQIVQDLYKDNTVYEKQRSVATFYDLLKQISNYKELNTVDVDVIFDWNKIPIHDTTKKVQVIIFAFCDKNEIEIYRPDIYDPEIIERAVSKKTFQIEKNIHEQIYSCIWSVKYTDETFSPRLKYVIDKKGLFYHV